MWEWEAKAASRENLSGRDGLCMVFAGLVGLTMGAARRRPSMAVALASGAVGLTLSALATRLTRHLSAHGRKVVTFETCDVFSSTAFGGNPLAVVFGAEALTDDELQRIAAEFGYSETTFVMPPEKASSTARVRIFTPTAELPFAGHPNVGTAAVLARRGKAFGKPVGSEVRFEEGAGVVPLDIICEDGVTVGATLTAPEAFRIVGPPPPLAAVAAAIGVGEDEIVTTNHLPMVGTVGLQFLLVELSSLEALGRSRGLPAPFTELTSLMQPGQVAPAGGRLLAYVRTPSSADAASTRIAIRARMHRANGTEDPGTGSANCALIGLLASLSRDGPAAVTEAVSVSATILQGVEMGRPSVLLASADRLPGDAAGAAAGFAPVGRVRIGGHVASVSRGELVCV